jgi:hypothetical protein
VSKRSERSAEQFKIVGNVRGKKPLSRARGAHRRHPAQNKLGPALKARSLAGQCNSLRVLQNYNIGHGQQQACPRSVTFSIMQLADNGEH